MSFKELFAAGRKGELAVAESLEKAGYKVTFLDYRAHAADFIIEKDNIKQTVEVKLHQKCKGTASGIWPAFNVEVYTAHGSRPGHFSETVDIFVNIDEVEEKAYFYDCSIIRDIYKSSHMEGLKKAAYIDGEITAYICEFSLPKVSLIGPTLNNLSCREINKLSPSPAFDNCQAIEAFTFDSPLYLGCRKLKLKKE